jgi:hypothetical protein
MHISRDPWQKGNTLAVAPEQCKPERHVPMGVLECGEDRTNAVGKPFAGSRQKVDPRIGQWLK